MKDRIRICVQEGEKIYKVTSIYLLNDGSFKIDVPYCGHEKGVVEKYNFPDEVYKRIFTWVERKESESFFVKNRPQLSIHASGFVQFSGKGIISGIDKKTGKYKGLAIKSAPLETPIGSGPTCGILFWGLEKGYENNTKISGADFIIPENIFTPVALTDKEISNTYKLEFWIFPDNEYYSKTIHADAYGNEYIAIRFPNFLPSPDSVLVMRVIRLKKIKSFIALFPTKTCTIYPTESDFGFYMGAPAEKIKEGWQTMHAISPPPKSDAFYTKKDLSYLDY